MTPLRKACAVGWMPSSAPCTGSTTAPTAGRFAAASRSPTSAWKPTPPRNSPSPKPGPPNGPNRPSGIGHQGSAGRDRPAGLGLGSVLGIAGAVETPRSPRTGGTGGFKLPRGIPLDGLLAVGFLVRGRPVGALRPGGDPDGGVGMRVATPGDEPLHLRRARQLDPGRYQLGLPGGELHPADLLVPHVRRRQAEPPADPLHDRGARSGVGVETGRGGGQLRVVRVARDEPVVAVRDQVDGPLAGGVVLPVAPFVKG